MIKPHQDGWLFTQRDDDSFLLPNPPLTRVSNFYDRANRIMDSPTHQTMVMHEGDDDEDEDSAPTIIGDVQAPSYRSFPL